MSRSHLLEKDDILILFLATLALFAAFHFLYKPVTEEQSDTPKVGDLEPFASVSRRHASQFNWDTLESTSPVFLHDLVYVPEGQHARVTFGPGQVLEIGPNSLVQFEEIRKDNVDVTLFYGAAKSSAPAVVVKPRAATAAVKPPPRPPALPSLPPYDEIETRQAQLNSELEPLTRQPPPRPGSSVPRAPELTQLGFESYQVKLLAPAPLAQFPGNRASFAVKWTPIPLDHVRFNIEISHDRGFKDGVAFPSASDHGNVVLEQRGVYFIRVLARRNGAHTFSDSRQIRVGKGS